MNLRISVYFHQIVPIRSRIKWYIFSMSITACFHYNTDSWVDVTSVIFKSKKVHEDKIFDRLDLLQFFSEVSKDYKYLNSQTSEWHFKCHAFMQSWYSLVMVSFQEILKTVQLNVSRILSRGRHHLQQQKCFQFQTHLKKVNWYPIGV